MLMLLDALTASVMASGGGGIAGPGRGWQHSGYHSGLLHDYRNRNFSCHN